MVPVLFQAACGQFYKHFTPGTYGPSEISSTFHCMHAQTQRFQNGLAYFVTAVSYTREY